MINYKVGDYLIQIKNAAMGNKKSVEVQKTNAIKAVADVLKKEGFLSGVEVKDGLLISTLALHSKEPVLVDIKLVSKPGLRIYRSADEIVNRPDKSSILIISSSRGVISSKDVVKAKIGGEVIAEVW